MEVVETLAHTTWVCKYHGVHGGRTYDEVISAPARPGLANLFQLG